VRMPLEQTGGSVMRFRANHRVGAHQVAGGRLFTAPRSHHGDAPKQRL
jgi:hypothetical protein